MIGLICWSRGCSGWLQAEQDYKKEENHMKVYGTRCTRIGLVKRHLVWRNRNLGKMKYLIPVNEG